MKIDFAVYSTVGPASDLIIQLLNECINDVSGIGVWTSGRNDAIQKCVDSGSRIIGTVVPSTRIEAFRIFCGENDIYSGPEKYILLTQNDILGQAVYLSQLQQFFMGQLTNEDIEKHEIDYVFDGDGIFANMKSICRSNHLLFSEFKGKSITPLEISYESLNQRANKTIGEVAEFLGTMHIAKGIKSVMNEHRSKHCQFLNIDLEKL